MQHPNASEDTSNEDTRKEVKKKWWQNFCRCFAPTVPPDVSLFSQLVSPADHMSYSPLSCACQNRPATERKSVDLPFCTNTSVNTSLPPHSLHIIPTPRAPSPGRRQRVERREKICVRYPRPQQWRCDRSSIPPPLLTPAPHLTIAHCVTAGGCLLAGTPSPTDSSALACERLCLRQHLRLRLRLCSRLINAHNAGSDTTHENSIADQSYESPSGGQYVSGVQSHGGCASVAPLQQAISSRHTCPPLCLSLSHCSALDLGFLLI